MIIASATNDRETIIKDHFGDAEFFSIYEVLENKINYIGITSNTSRLEEGSHTEKAFNIIQLLEKNKVDVLVNRAFGSNLKIIDKSLLPIIIRTNSIEKALSIVQLHYQEILCVTKERKQCYMTISEENIVKIIGTK